MARVLIVDDEPDAVELLREFLTAKGYEVLAASDGEEALRKVKEDRPDLILLDMCMPKMNGLEVLKQVREIDHKVGVIMVTAISEVETGRQALKLGAFDYITKPLDLKYLERSLRELGAAPRMDTILVVEDDAQCADLLKDFLEDESRAVILARTGAEGRTILQGTPVCLVLLDLVLPDMNGLHLLQQAQQLDTPPDVVIVTGHASLESAIKAIEAGAAGYVLKPIDATQLRTLVGRVLERRRLQRENAALYERLERERRQLEVLYDVSRRLISVRDTDEILSLIVNEASRLLGAEAVALRLLEGEEFVLRAHTESAGSLTSRSRVRASASVSGLVAAECGPVAIEDLLEDTRYDRANARGVAAQGFRSFLGVPLWVHGELIGVLNVYTTVRRRFMPDEISLLSALADQASLAIDNARLFQQEQGRRQQLEAVQVVTAEIIRELNLRAVLDLIMRRAVELVETSSGMLRLWDEEAGLLVSQSWAGLDQQRAAVSLRLGEGVAGTAAERRQGLLVNDFRHSPYATPLLLERTTHVAVLAEPLLYRDRLVGVINLNREEPGRPFTEDDRQLLALFAAQAAIAIENARLFSAAERRATELATLREMGQAIISRLELPAVLKAVVAGAMQLLGSQHTQIVLWDEESQRLRYGAAVGPEAERVRTQIFELGRGINGTVALTRKPLIVDDYQASPYALPEFSDVVATITVPILFENGLLGVLHSHTTQPGKHFTSDDLRLLQMLAAQAAIAIENARLLEKVEMQRAHLAQLFESASDAIVVADNRGNIVSWNTAAQNIFDYTEEEVVGKPLALLIPETYQGAHQSGLEQMGTTGELHVIEKTVELHAVRKDGSGFPIELSLAALKTAEGTYYSGIIRDITLRKEADQMKSDFVSFVTHQLRTPLAGIKWMLELAVQDSEVPAETRSYIQDAQTSNERLVRLVNDLLDVSRLERGKLTIVPQEIRLEELTQSVLSDLTPLIAERVHRVSVTVASEVSPVWADLQLLRQVILNLASNAVKYTPPGGEITIRMEQEGAAVCWAIQDSGIGIPREAQRRLFEKFYRAENVVKMETEGTGLGLYLVRLILEQFGGRVWCESEEGKGSTFRFTLPRQEERDGSER